MHRRGDDLPHGLLQRQHFRARQGNADTHNHTYCGKAIAISWMRESATEQNRSSFSPGSETMSQLDSTLPTPRASPYNPQNGWRRRTGGFTVISRAVQAFRGCSWWEFRRLRSEAPLSPIATPACRFGWTGSCGQVGCNRISCGFSTYICLSLRLIRRMEISCVRL